MGKGKDLKESDKKIIINVRNYFTKERDQIRAKLKIGKLKPSDIPFKYNDVVGRTADAVKLSRNTVVNVSKESNTTGTVSKSKKSKAGRKKIEIDSFTEGVIRRSVVDCFSRRTFPTVKKLNTQLQSDVNFPRMSNSSLWKVMKKQLKFKFIKFQGKPIPMERADIKAQRFLYLRRVAKLRKEGYKIYFQDESWVNANQTVSRGWHIPGKEVLGMSNTMPHVDIWLKGVGHRFSDDLIGGISSKPSGAGLRAIMIAIGSEDGFLQGTTKTFLGKKNSSDYHHEMNSIHFNEWFKDVVEKIPERSVIVVDQATYHRTVTEDTKNPTSSWRKSEIIAWIISHNVPLPSEFESFEKMTVPLLRILARKHEIAKKYVLEKIIEDSGKDIVLLWLPVAHCELSPIELVWSMIKRNVSVKNTTFKINDVLTLALKELESEEIKDLWKGCVEHVLKLEKIIAEKEAIYEEILDAGRARIVIIPRGDSDSSSETDSSGGTDSESGDTTSDDCSVSYVNQMEVD